MAQIELVQWLEMRGSFYTPLCIVDYCNCTCLGPLIHGVSFFTIEQTMPHECLGKSHIIAL